VKEVNTQEFNETIKEGVTLVDFFATWCGPCKMLSPILDELSEEMSDVKFIKVDTDQNMNLAQQYNIMSIPAVFLFRDGEVIGSFVGMQPKNSVKSFIEQHLN